MCRSSGIAAVLSAYFLQSNILSAGSFRNHVRLHERDGAHAQTAKAETSAAAIEAIDSAVGWVL
ncbi:hypothetical protein XvhCFBP2543_08505 [Xanthomonas vasicola]|nr:hypothetical protein NX04_17335 [Xanthomonas vasicola]KGR39765.1 hypothetical protein NX05_17545 [Xanthomonas vasicola]KGR60719.1 hypothetical protein NX79_09260 [Xanthomonas vasicola]PPV03036.1 hypothetical protein XvhCFBP2543_08505 [Xanthomonas vasicola]